MKTLSVFGKIGASLFLEWQTGWHRHGTASGDFQLSEAEMLSNGGTGFFSTCETCKPVRWTGLGVLSGPWSLNYLGGTFRERESWFAFWPQDPELQTDIKEIRWRLGGRYSSTSRNHSCQQLSLPPSWLLHSSPFPHNPHEAKWLCSSHASNVAVRGGGLAGSKGPL